MTRDAETPSRKATARPKGYGICEFQAGSRLIQVQVRDRTWGVGAVPWAALLFGRGSFTASGSRHGRHTGCDSQSSVITSFQFVASFDSIDFPRSNFHFGIVKNGNSIHQTVLVSMPKLGLDS